MQLKRNKEMEFKTLKKNYKKQIVIGALAICIIGGALTFNLTRAKYKITEEIPLVRGNVNYSVPDLRVVAIKTSEDGINYTDTSEIPTTGYSLNTEKSMCKVATNSIASAPKDNNITIEYTDGKINFLGVTKQSTRCYLYFDKYEPTASDTILANITPKDTTPDFSQTATTDEGVYAVEDGMYGGTSYYWRGAVTNNYVRFANFCWRIVRINGDGSIRLIYDGTTCHANGTSTEESIAVAKQKYNTSDDSSEYVGWTYSIGSQRTTSGTASNVKSQTENWYSSNITGTNANKVADGKFCNDRNTASGHSWSSQPSSSFYYAARERLELAKTATLSCPTGDVYTLKVGAITADEVVMAGEKCGIGNNSYYLYNGQNYWTMSPYRSSSTDGYSAVVFLVGGIYLSQTDVHNTTPGLRPVINLNSNVTFSGGDGTLSNPYVVQ